MFSMFAKRLKGHYVLPVLMYTVLSVAFVNATAQEPTPTASAPAPQEADNGVQTAPVVVDGSTLFYVRGVSAFPAVKRAQQTAGSIQALAANRAFSPQSLRLQESPVGTRILAGNQPLMTIFDADARLEGVERQVLAKAYLMRIGEAIEAYRHDREPKVLAQHAFYALMATLALLLGFWVGRRGVKRVHFALDKRYKEKVQGLQIQSFYLLQVEQLWHVLTGALGLLWVIIALTAVYVYLECVLSLFPWTRGTANRLIVILVDPLREMGSGVLQEVPSLVFLAILALVTKYLLKLIRLFFDGIDKGTVSISGFDAAWGRPTYRLVRTGVIAFALVIAYPYIPGSSSAAFKGVSLFIGVIFSLGSTSLIGNIIAGYTMVYRRTFMLGDRVKIGDHLGDVHQTGVMVTTLRTPKNEAVVVPNSMILNEEIINYSMLARQGSLILHTTVGIGYETPWRQVEAMLLEAAARTSGLLCEPKPFVLQKELGDFAVIYEINAHCDEPRAMLQLYNALHQNILDVFNEYGVQIMTPAYRSDPAQAKVVPRDQWYSAPARPPES